MFESFKPVMPQFVLAVMYTIIYSGVLYMVFSGTANIPTGLRDTANILIGMLTTVQLGVLDFFFRSSAGSKNKDASAAAVVAAKAAAKLK